MTISDNWARYCSASFKHANQILDMAKDHAYRVENDHFH